MPSPFPGMDPYLEDPGGWQNFHNCLIADIGDELNSTLPAGYFAVATERVTVEHPFEVPRPIGPDVSILKRGHRGGHSAVAEHDAPVHLAVQPFEILEASLEIRDRKGKRLVTAIELLSPTNKAASGVGRALYLRKQQEILSSPVNLVEIDLLRSGTWTLSVIEVAARHAVEFDYLVCVSRADDRGHVDLYPARLQDRLPRIAIPLTGDDADAVVNLQSLLARRYDRGRMADQIDYSVEPIPPLSPAQAAWADDLLRRAGLRRPQPR